MSEQAESHERLSDEQVATLTLLSQHCLYCDPAECGDKAIASLAREVQEWRDKDKADDLTHLRLSVDMLNVRDLCARHDITVEGIVALVDKLFAEDGWYLTQDGYPRSIHEGIGNLRRLARGEADR